MLCYTNQSIAHSNQDEVSYFVELYVLHPLLEYHSKCVSQCYHEGSFHLVHNVCRWMPAERVNTYSNIRPAELCY